MPTIYLKVTANDINVRDVQEALNVYFPNMRTTVEAAPAPNTDTELVEALKGIATAGEIYGTQWDSATMGNVARAALARHKA